MRNLIGLLAGLGDDRGAALLGGGHRRTTASGPATAPRPTRIAEALDARPAAASASAASPPGPREGRGLDLDQSPAVADPSWSTTSALILSRSSDDPQARPAGRWFGARMTTPTLRTPFPSLRHASS